MSLFECKTCGGKIKIKPGSPLGICDSCGNTIELDSETVKKYQSLFEKAERKMKLNSLSSFKEALAIFGDIPFIEGSEEKTSECNRRIADYEAKEAERKKSGEAIETKDTKIGVVLLVISVIALLIVVAGICVFAYMFIKGKLSDRAMIISGVIIALGVLTFIVSKFQR